MRAVVTRLLPQAQRWAQALTQRGHSALVLPLIEIGPPLDASSLEGAVRHLSDFSAVMFVSSPAVDAFCAAAAMAGIPLASVGLRAWCTGPGTGAALVQQGWPADRVDMPDQQAAQFDSEALWQRVGAQVRPGRRVLIVRGDSEGAVHDGAQGAGVGRDWLAQRLCEAGAEVAFAVAYRRRLPDWSAQQRLQAQAAASDGSVWLFSSAEALAHLQRLLPTQDWSRARSIATHPRIAAAARGLGFGVVRESRPSLSDVVASLESLA